MAMATLLVSVLGVSRLAAQQGGPDRQPPPNEQPGDGVRGGPPFGPGGPGGLGGPGGPMRAELKLVKQFDKNADGWLNSAERQPARERLKTTRLAGGRGFGPGGPGGRFGAPGEFLAQPFQTALDTDKDGKLSPDELRHGLKKRFTELDTSRAGFLQETQVTEGLSRILPRPPGFGGAGGPRGFGPVVAQYRGLIDGEVKADTRKLSSYESFVRATAPEPASDGSDRGREISLRSFADRRRKFLLEYQQPRPTTP